jgi:hypothetical protein
MLGPLAVLLFSTYSTVAQANSTEQRVPLGNAAIALDGTGTAAVEATLVTTGINGAADTPVTNINMLLKNVSPVFFTYVSGFVSFYDSTGVRCGEGIFKADVLAPGELIETDAPGIRIKCAPSSWRIVVTNLVPRLAPVIEMKADTPVSSLRISVDGEDQPIQIDKPLVLTL